MGIFYRFIKTEDGLVVLSIALGSMSANEIVSATSPWHDPEFRLAVQYQMKKQVTATQGDLK